MKKILIVGNLLRIGGAEKLMFELVNFALANNLQPVILILDNFDIEYYDSVYKALGVEVIRTRIQHIKNFRAPLRMLTSCYWYLKLKFSADTYKSLHVIGMYNVNKVFTTIPHKHRYFWHVNNTVQFPDEIYPYSQDFFQNEDDTIVCINSYQQDELYRQYGRGNIKSKINLLKIFINQDDTN